MTVYGIYRDADILSDALEELRLAGFRGTDVSVLIPENLASNDFVLTKETQAPEGATSAAVVGGAVGWLAGVGVLVIPGLGPFIAAGPIMGLLAGAGTGSVAGGIAGSLMGMGIPEYEAKRYEGRVRSGGILLSVHCDSSEWLRRAKSILEQSAAQDVASAGESSADYAMSDRPTTPL